MSELKKKFLFIIIVYVIWYTGIYLLIKPDIFQNIYYLIYLIMLYAVGILDTIIRPIEIKKKEKGSFRKYIGILFLINPFLMILAVIEVEFWGWRSDLISTLGLILYFMGVVMVLISRYSLGKQATGTLVIRDDHELITSGIYKYVRHPIYGSGMFGIIGFVLVTQSIIISILTIIIYFKIFHDRVEYEEQLLLEEFGTEYEKYMKNSKKFIPLIW